MRYSAEYDPFTLKDKDDKTMLAQWLRNSNAYYDTTETEGIAATRLVIEDRLRMGWWIIPLKTAIDAEKSNLIVLQKLTIYGRCGPNVHVVNTSDGEILEATLAWDSADGADHSAEIDIDAMFFFPQIVEVVSPALNDTQAPHVNDYSRDPKFRNYSFVLPRSDLQIDSDK